jgi:CLIP-associating protein 1/2
MRAADLELLLPQLLPPLYDAFKSPCADVRKAVTFALVQMHGVLGESLAPHLAELSSSQLKLVMIYINRTGGKTRDDSAGR